MVPNAALPKDPLPRDAYNRTGLVQRARRQGPIVLSGNTVPPCNGMSGNARGKVSAAFRKKGDRAIVVAKVRIAHKGAVLGIE